MLKRRMPSVSYLLVFLLSLLSVTWKIAQAQVATEWVTRFNGPINGNDFASGLAIDEAENVYVTGRTPGSGGASDYATVKYDALGNELWAVRYNGPGNFNDNALAIVVDGAGNAYVTGESTGSDGFYDFATIKYDTNSNVLWVARYNGPDNGWDYAVALAVDPSGNVFVTGYQTGADGTSNSDYATVKYDPDGHQLWVATYNGLGGGSDSAVAIAVDAAGNAHVVGRSTGSDGTSDYAVIKYDPDGNELWVAMYSFSNWQEFPSALAVDSAGNVYVTGSSVAPFNPQDPNTTNSDYATVKYDTDGQLVWAARYNGIDSSFFSFSSIDVAADIAVDAAGQVFVTGRSERVGRAMDYATINYDVNGNELWVARYNGIGNGLNSANKLALDSAGNVYVTGSSPGEGGTLDYATIKYDVNSNELWVARYNGPGNGSDSPAAIAVDDSGNVYITGSSDGSGNSSDYATVKFIAATNSGSADGSGGHGGSSACFIDTLSNY